MMKSVWTAELMIRLKMMEVRQLHVPEEMTPERAEVIEECQQIFRIATNAFPLSATLVIFRAQFILMYTPNKHIALR
jgi:hypothetical protein